MKPEVRLIWQVGALLGEGPAWFPDEQALRFVDIKGGRLHRYHPASMTCETLAVGGQPSFVFPLDDGGMVVGSEHGIHRVEDGSLGQLIARIEQPSHNRTNDATVDADGRLWIATMDDAEERETGTLWCLDKGSLRHAGTHAVVTNGPAVTSDLRHLYHVDSARRLIMRHPLDSGLPLQSGKVVVQLQEHEGHPDGLVLDSEDCLWVGLWDGWGVRRYAPDGTLLLHIDLPCARVTKVAFGGPDLRTAYVTTASVGLSDTERAEQPLAGSLFAFEAPVAGRPLVPVKLA